MSGRFWTADLHLGHQKVADLRGFKSVEEHDDTILTQIRSLPKGTTLWVLGDVTGGRGEKEAMEKLREFDIQLHLIAGNHDSVSSIHRTGFRRQAKWFETFESIQQFGRVRIGGHQVLMSHYPYESAGDGPGRGEARYLHYRLPDLGMPLLHGHTHQDTPEDAHPLSYCVSWDAHRGLVSEEKIRNWLDKLNTVVVP